MNIELAQYARDYIKERLAKLPLHNHKVFKRMYSPLDLDADINDVVDSMPDTRLDWAMTQVQRSVVIEQELEHEDNQG